MTHRKRRSRPAPRLISWVGGVLTAIVAAIASAYGTNLGSDLFNSITPSNSSSSSNSNLSWLTTFLAWFGIAVGIIAVVSILITALISWRRRNALRTRVERLKDRSDEDDNKAGPVEVEERRLVGYIVQRDAAERELAPYLPANPRRAKRLINHERLYGRIAEERRIFGGQPELTYHHLTKWVLIVENWPRLGAALTRNPSMMQQLEQPKSIGELQDVLNNTVPGVTVTDDLIDILHKGVQLSPVITRLVRFEPALSELKGFRAHDSSIISDALARS